MSDVPPTTTSTPEPAKRPRRRLRRWQKVLLTLFLIFVVLPVTAWVVLDFVTRAALRRELAKIQVAGESARWEDVAPGPQPDRENAADVYWQAFRRFVDLEADTDVALVEALERNGGEPWTEKYREQLATVGGRDLNAELLTETAAWGSARRWIAENADALALLRKANGIPYCVFTPTGTDFLPEYAQWSKVRKATWILTWDARLRRKEGDIIGVYGTAHDLIVLSRAARQPLLVGYLIENLVLAHALNDALKESLPDDTNHPVEWRRLLSDLERLDRRIAFAAAYQGERAATLLGMHTASTAPWTMVGRQFRRPGLPRALIGLYRPVRQYDEAQWLRCSGELVAAAKTDRSAWIGAGKRLMAQEEDVPRVAWMTRLMVPTLARPFIFAADIESEQALAQVALALKLHKHQNGAYPDALAPLAPEFLKEVPTDPCNGKPLVYRRQGDGFVLYSVGIDQTDDGGKEPPPERPGQREGVDYVWRAAQ